MTRFCSHASILAFVVALVRASGLGPLRAPAQTPAATVAERSDNVVLRSVVDGALLAPGERGTGTISTTGAGTRLMWHPAQAALRAGEVRGSQWNGTNVGTWSVTFALNAMASGTRAVAMGLSTTASSNQTVVMGNGTMAEARNATATGEQATASRAQAVAMGDGSTASAANSVAMGFSTIDSGSQALSMGNGATASGVRATAMDRRTEAATSESLTIGQCNDSNTAADGTLFVVGNGSSASGSCDSHDDVFTVGESGSATASSHDSFSDRRLKTGIEPLGDNGLKKLEQLHAARYEFKNQKTRPSGEQIGLIAKDVQEEFPELVSEGADGMLSLAYPKLTSVLLKGLQEQRATIDRQSSRLESLKRLAEEIDEIKKRVAVLETAWSTALSGWSSGPFGLFLAALVGVLLGAGFLHVHPR